MSPQISAPPLLILILVAVAILVLAVVIAVTLRRARKTAEVSPDAGELRREQTPPRNITAKGMLLAFSRGLGFLKQHVAGRDYRYEVPWILMIGPQGAGTTTALANAGGSAPLTRLGGPTFGIPGGPEWWFYQRGLVLNAPGATVLRSDGRTSDQVGWFALLQLLVRRRARRPLDAVILAISAEDLLEDENPKATAADLTARAEILCQKLSQLRRAVSMRMPVYVVITKCDQVPGFSSFAGELPSGRHAEIFGWSNPYPLEAAFSADWVDECCRDMHERIMQQQMEIFVERDQLQESDGVFLFPAQFRALGTPLRQYLSLIFQSTAYEESYYFRGIYFCGDIGLGAVARQPEPVAALALAARAGGNHESSIETAVPETGLVSAAASVAVIPRPVENRKGKPVFLNHLFERKIFPESILARPLSVIDMSRNRTVLTAKIATALFVLVVGIGMLVNFARFYNLKSAYLGPLLRELAGDVGEGDIRKAILSNETPEARDSRRQHATAAANNVLRSMGALSENRLRSVFLPASWNGVVDRDVEAAMSRAFGTIVLEGFRIDLTYRLKDLVQATPENGSETSGGGGAVVAASDGVRLPVQQVYDNFANVPEYGAWAKYISGLRELEANIGRYNRIASAGQGSTEDLKNLLQYLHLNSGLPADFDFENPYFEALLRQSTNQQFSFHNDDPAVYDEGEAVDHAKELIEGFFTAWFGSENRLQVDVDRMISAINLFPTRGNQVSYQSLKDIADTITRVSDDLENPAYESLLSGDFDLKDYPEFSQSIRDLNYLKGLQYDSEIGEYGREGFRRFTSDLAARSTRLTGLVLGLDSVPVQLTGSVMSLRANLRILLGQTFVAREPGPPRSPDSANPIWDRNTLLEAGKLFDAYDKYERGSLGAAPPMMREALRRVALDRLQANVLDYVGEAQSSPAAGAPDGAAAQSFTQSLDVLQRLLLAFAKFPDPAAARNFASVLVGQASRMLVAIENELTDKNLYAVREQNFDWWEGEKPLSLVAYDVRSADDLKDYVDRERDQVTTLAQQADLLVRFLQPRSAALGPQETKALSDWRGISLELKRYTDKAAGNSVLLLEDFIRTGMDKITPETSCQDNTRDPIGRTDFFLTKRSSLRTGELTRCRVLSQRVYTTQIATLFNRRLGGRFPFSAAQPPQNSFQEADPAALVEFFAKFDQYVKVATESLTQNSQLGKPRDAALGFLSQMAAIRSIFAAFLMGVEKNPAPAFDFAVNFRVNRNKEIEGNQIFDWGLDVGQQSLQYRAKENTGHWRLGDPIRVTLRFADDSPSVPVMDNSQPGMTVRQRTVTFEYTDPWSLFRLLLEHQPPPAEFDRGADPTPHTLSIYIPTMPDKSLPQRKDGTAAQVRVYMQITIVPMGAKDGVSVPLPFPVQAPVVTEN